MWPPWEAIGLPIWIVLQVFNLLVGAGGQTAPPLSEPAAVVAPARVQPGAHPMVAAADAPPCVSAIEVPADGGSWP
jgi:hypothetical protein